MADRKIDIIINADDLASKEIKKLEKNVWKLQSSFQKVWKQVWKVWKSVKDNMKKISVWVWIAWTAVVVAWKQFLDLGSNIELTQKKANTVFGEYIKDVEKFADETWKAMWLSKNEFLSAASGIQDLLIPMWFARDEATRLTTDTISLAWALAEWSWGSRTAAEVSEILAKAYLWETESLKWLGIALSAEIINKRVAENATKWLTWATHEQSRALAIQQLIFEKSTDAQEAYKNGSGSLARQQAELSATIKNARDSIAVWLIPAMNELLKTLAPVIEEVWKNIQQWAKNKDNIEAMKNSLVSAIETFKTIWNIIKTVWNILSWFWNAIFEVWEKIWLFLSWITILFWNLTWSLDTFWETSKRAAQEFKDAFWLAFWSISTKIDILKRKFNDIKSAVWLWWGWDIDWARADGWPVQAGKTFLVWERWPELFTPNSSWNITSNEDLRAWSWDVNINMWGVTVTNEADENRLIENLTRAIQLQKMGIS